LTCDITMCKPYTRHANTIQSTSRPKKLKADPLLHGSASSPLPLAVSPPTKSIPSRSSTALSISRPAYLLLIESSAARSLQRVPSTLASLDTQTRVLPSAPSYFGSSSLMFSQSLPLLVIRSSFEPSPHGHGNLIVRSLQEAVRSSSIVIERQPP
jgi:hypothetical protein